MIFEWLFSMNNVYIYNVSRSFYWLAGTQRSYHGLYRRLGVKFVVVFVIGII